MPVCRELDRGVLRCEYCEWLRRGIGLEHDREPVRCPASRVWLSCSCSAGCWPRRMWQCGSLAGEQYVQYMHVFCCSFSTIIFMISSRTQPPCHFVNRCNHLRVSLVAVPQARDGRPGRAWRRLSEIPFTTDRPLNRQVAVLVTGDHAASTNRSMSLSRPLILDASETGRAVNALCRRYAENYV
jgi:hypothetical protein